MSDLIGSTLGRYQIVAAQGHGGMADVYKVYQPSLDRFVAIKILHSSLADKKGFVQRFEREGAALARLRHPNIIQVHDFDTQDDLHYLVMEFIDGLTLRDALMERIDQGKVFFFHRGRTHPHLRPTPLSSTILPARPISSSVNRGLSWPA